MPEVTDDRLIFELDLIAFESRAAHSVAHSVAQVDAIGEHGKGGGLETEFAVLGGGGFGPLEGAAFQSFGVNPEAGAIPVQEFD